MDEREILELLAFSHFGTEPVTVHSRHQDVRDNSVGTARFEEF